jgi:hypothetical protein
MKKLFTIAVMLFTMASFAQLKVTESKPGSEQVIGEYKLLGKMYAKLSKEGEYAVMLYRDEKFTQIDEYKHFIFKYADLDALYGLFTNFEGVEKGTTKEVEIEDGHKLIFTYGKTMGQMHAKVTHRSPAGTEGELRYLTPKQLKALFGKK